MIDGLLLKLMAVQMAKYSTHELFDKSQAWFESEIDGMEDGEKAELIEVAGEQVREDFEEGGRWSNYRTRIYKFSYEGEFVFISISDEVPATEMQEGGDFMKPEIEQVFPHKVETTVYKTTPQDTAKPKGGR